MSTPQPEPDLIRDLAELLAGLQVARSIQGGFALGTSLDSYDRLRRQLGMFGWQRPPEYEVALRARLTELNAGTRP